MACPLLILSKLSLTDQKLEDIGCSQSGCSNYKHVEIKLHETENVITPLNSHTFKPYLSF